MPTLAVTLRDRLSTDELHQLKWLLGQFLALMAMWALFGLEMGSEPVLLLFTLLVAATLAFPRLPGRIPSLFWKAATPTLIAIIVVDFALHGVEFLKPMVRMILLLTLLRSLQYRKAREDLQLVLLCLFTLVVKGVLTVSLLFAFQMLLFTPAAMALLFLINLLETSRERMLIPEDWERFRWGRFLDRLAKGLDFRLIGFAAMLFIGLVSVSSLIFVLMPRFSMDQALPFLKMEGSGKVGFSDRIRFGDVNDLSFDDSRAMRVTVPNLNVVPVRPFWRMVVLDEYDNGVFEVSRSLMENTIPFKEGSSYPERHYDRSGNDPSNNWVYYLEGDISRYLPLIGTYDTIRFQKTKFWPFAETDVFMLEQVPSQLFGYQVSGMTPMDRFAATPSDRAELDSAEGPIPTPGFDEERLDYPLTTLAIPSSPKEQEYLHGLVNEIREGQQLPPAEFAQRAQTWLQQHYRYDTRHRPLMEDGSDPLLLWMRESDRGWCEHFAGSFTLLCRTAGIPARVVAGFAGAYWNDYEDYLIVNNSNAHAWVEIYLDGYWVRYDPTPPAGGGFLPGAALASSIGAISGWSAWVDSLRMVWYRRVVNFDQSDQMEMASGLKDYSLAAYEDLKRDISAAWTRFKVWLLSGWNREKTIEVLLWIAGVCFAIVALRYLWRMLREAAGRGGPWAGLMGGDPIRRQAGKLLIAFRPLWHQKREMAQPQGGSPESLSRWQEALEGLQRIRFGPAEDRPDHRAVFKEAKRLMRAGPEKV